MYDNLNRWFILKTEELYENIDEGGKQTFMRVVINNEEIGNRIKTIREKANISLNDLSKNIGISKNVLMLYEEGNKQVNINNIIKICNYFNEEIDNLVSYTILL